MGMKRRSAPVDEALARRVRSVLGEGPHLSEKRMFGGLCFLFSGHMICGLIGDELMVRVGPDQYQQALSHRDAREMDFTGRPLRGFVYVRASGCASEAAVHEWVGRGVRFVGSLPPK